MLALLLVSVAAGEASRSVELPPRHRAACGWASGCLAESTALLLGATRSDGGFHELLALFVCSEGARVFL